MYEYKVDIYKVKYAEEAMNTLAKDRWRVIAIAPDHHTGFIDVFYEREKLDSADTDETDAVSASVAATGEEILGDREAFADNDEPENNIGEDDNANYAVRDDIWDFDGSADESEENQ